MIIGIVGSEKIKFTAAGEAAAKGKIREILTQAILTQANVTEVCSGACHLGGIDVWAEEIGRELGLKVSTFPPKVQSWEGGYKPRNIQIAEHSEVVHCITVDNLPLGYIGMKFKFCYHCHTSGHVKSGGCWTAKYAIKIGKEAKWHIIHNGV